MYLKKIFTDQYGNTAEAFYLKKEQIEGGDAGVNLFNVDLQAFSTDQKKQDGAKSVDNFKCSNVTITDDQILAAAPTTMAEKLDYAILSEIITATKEDEEGNTFPKYTFTGCIGEITFAGGIIIQ